MKEHLEVVFLESLKNKPDSKETLRDWIYLFLDLEIPDSHLDGEDSNADPMEAIWLSYLTYKNNSGDENPGFIWLSSRDSCKTLGASILAVIVMVFFEASICWLASIEPQSKIALNNVQSFIAKLKPLLEKAGRNIDSSNARNLELISTNGEKSSITVLVATMASVNGKHVNCVFVDEVDLLRDPRVLDEIQAVASLIGNQFPLRTYFSTRKFSFSRMQQIIDKREELGLKLIKWDILDVTEHCPPSRHKPSLPKVKMFIHPEPPLRSVTEEVYLKMQDVEQKQYHEIEAYAGCQDCKLLSQCKMRLAHRPKKDKGKLWKKIQHTINLFRSMSPDMALAQLMCKRPSMAGLVYPRFDEVGNTITIANALKQICEGSFEYPTLTDIITELKRNEIKIYVGGDWGSTACQAFVVSCVIPGGDWWILDAYAISGLEFDDVIALGEKIRDTYSPVKWFMDTNQPMFIKAFNKRGMRCAEFKKDVAGGIECVRAKVMNATGVRKLKVIKHERTDIVLEMFRKHHFILDSLGKPTDSPDDGEAWSDVGDSVRYIGQNLFGNERKAFAVSYGAAPVVQNQAPKTPETINQKLMQEKIRSFANGAEAPTTKSVGGFKWNF